MMFRLRIRKEGFRSVKRTSYRTRNPVQLLTTMGRINSVHCSCGPSGMLLDLRECFVFLLLVEINPIQHTFLFFSLRLETGRIG